MFNNNILYNYLIKFKQEHDGNSPTIREIMEGTGIPSTSSTSRHLRRLIHKNLITLDDHSRIYIINATWSKPK